METKKKTIRCAIYTRKSSEEGLEQDFNSLDAQREACESYIKSQQHEGWTLIEKQYNDGGFSGGTLERPALKDLFQDIEDGKVDTVVVYKIDRLTRSLMDFSKIVEIFDKRSVTFVSITQQFNTTTSMGRLTLNILLSFAQFEREVTGERIRDKKAASAKKGMWISGIAPIGYELVNKKLVIDNDNKEKVKFIFEKYLELKSVITLKKYLEENNINTRNDKCFSKGNLYRILQNKTYIGLISHKSNDYEGEQEGIIDKTLFDRVQDLLTANRIRNKNCVNSTNPSLLAGKIYDDKGNYMSPSHSNKNGKRYRYYVSQALLQSRRNEAGSISKIPAAEIESVVAEEITNFLSDTKNIQQYIENYDIHKQKELLSMKKDRINNYFVRSVLSKVVLYKEKIDIILCKIQLLKTLEAITYDKQLPEELKEESKEPIFITKEIRISQTSRNGSVLIISDSEKSEVNVNSQLVKTIARSHYWSNLLLFGKVNNAREINKIENLTSHKYVYKVLELKFLAPEIIEKIMNGTQPRDLNIEKLFAVKTLDWIEQKKLLCF